MTCVRTKPFNQNKPFWLAQFGGGGLIFCKWQKMLGSPPVFQTNAAVSACLLMFLLAARQTFNFPLQSQSFVSFYLNITFFKIDLCHLPRLVCQTRCFQSFNRGNIHSFSFLIILSEHFSAKNNSMQIFGTRLLYSALKKQRRIRRSRMKCNVNTNKWKCQWSIWW